MQPPSQDIAREHAAANRAGSASKPWLGYSALCCEKCVGRTGPMRLSRYTIAPTDLAHVLPWCRTHRLREPLGRSSVSSFDHSLASHTRCSAVQTGLTEQMFDMILGTPGHRCHIKTESCAHWPTILASSVSSDLV